MNTTTTTTSSITLHTASYLTYCQQNKRLDPKTIKAYRIDLTQFAAATTDTSINNINPDIIKSYIATLHNTYKPKTVKRKIALPTVNYYCKHDYQQDPAYLQPFYNHFLCMLVVKNPS